jgi:hypothetical protein
MRKLLLLHLLVIGLAACDQLNVNEQIKPTRDDATFTMTVEAMSADKITEHCSALGVQYDANGCAAFNLDTKHCTIYVVAPKHANDTEQFAVIGHETWHCRYGAWHE